MIIAVTGSQCFFLQVVQQKYTAMGATIGQDLPVEFATNSISLQLPSNKVILEDGWIITPLFNPEVRDVLAVYQSNVDYIPCFTDHQGSSRQFQDWTDFTLMSANSSMD